MPLPRTASDSLRWYIVKLLFDHNLLPKLVRRLADLHPDSSHLFLLGMDQAADDLVWKWARQDGYTIVTKDSDVSRILVARTLGSTRACGV